MPEAAMAGVLHDSFWPFPHLPEVSPGIHPPSLALRPFALYEDDLRLDFDRTPRPILATNVLQCCTRSKTTYAVEPEFFWNLPVGKRIESLLTLMLSGSGSSSELPLQIHCSNDSCGEPAEIVISLDELALLQSKAYAMASIEVRIGQRVITLRRPTGADQIEWLAERHANGAAAQQAMLRTLVISDSEDIDLLHEGLADESLAQIEEAMDEGDPLIDFRVTVTCPHCDKASFVAIDLEDIALRALRQAQQRLLGSVHRLAARYHWTEQDIFAVPAWRRTEYLRLIANETQR
jgi:hypothetical protein